MRIVGARWAAKFFADATETSELFFCRARRWARIRLRRRSSRGESGVCGPMTAFVRIENSLPDFKKFPARSSREIVAKCLNFKGEWSRVFARMARNLRISLNLAPQQGILHRDWFAEDCAHHHSVPAFLGFSHGLWKAPCFPWLAG